MLKKSLTEHLSFEEITNVNDSHRIFRKLNTNSWLNHDSWKSAFFGKDEKNKTEIILITSRDSKVEELSKLMPN